MMRSAETHRLLQECLLDIVVDKLEKLCGLKKKEAKGAPEAAAPETRTAEKPVEGGSDEKPEEASTVPEEKKGPARPLGYKLNKISH